MNSIIFKQFIFLFLAFSSFIKAEEFSENLSPLINYLVNRSECHKQDPSQTIPIIAIAGCGGVGKTHFANLIMQKLKKEGVQCAVLPFDDFLLSPEERRKLGTQWDLNHISCDKLHDVFFQILSKEKWIKKPTYNPLKKEVGSEILDLQGCNLILFEGLYTLCSHPPVNFFAYCDSGIFLEADEADIFAWKWGRELQKDFPRSPQQFAKHMEAYLSDFYTTVAYSRKNATFVIKKGSQHQYFLIPAY
ncbi:MAG: hypothetical protein JSR39_05760 [Verrucomicrobia bacterium]|nr:hypothetical protein [Verrucomicrobiota bacterium]